MCPDSPFHPSLHFRPISTLRRWTFSASLAGWPAALLGVRKMQRLPHCCSASTLGMRRALRKSRTDAASLQRAQQPLRRPTLRAVRPGERRTVRTHALACTHRENVSSLTAGVCLSLFSIGSSDAPDLSHSDEPRAAEAVEPTRKSLPIGESPNTEHAQYNASTPCLGSLHVFPAVRRHAQVESVLPLSSSTDE
jgi:hypothetical protein